MNDSVIITPLVPGDADGLLKLVESERERLRTYFPVTTGRLTDRRAAKRYVAELVDKARERELYCFILRDFEEADPAGAIFLKQFDWSVPKCEIAYFVSEVYKRRGFATLGVIYTMDHAFTALGVNKIFARVDPENTASVRVLNNAGFAQEGRLSHDFRSGDGRLLDVLYFGKVKG